MQNENSGVNTVLLVIILLVIVAAGVWWFRGSSAPADEPSGAKVEVQIPSGSEEN